MLDRLARLIKLPIEWAGGAVFGQHGRRGRSLDTIQIVEPVHVTRRQGPVVGRSLGSDGTPEAAHLKPGRERLCGPVTLDEVGVGLGELNMSMRRWFTSDLPHEVSVYIPRAEVRIRKSRGVQETEMVLESITIVHSPRLPVRPRETPGQRE
ncbi:MAG: hypothetical protein ACM3X3_01790 [Betaproteobacteria bacterium]